MTTLTTPTTKIEKIETLKKIAKWYTYEGDHGVLLDLHGCATFETFAKLTESQLDELIADPTVCRPTYDESYGGFSEKGAEITDEERTNFENDQKIIYDGVWSLIEEAEADEYEREWIRLGGQYHDWKGTEYPVTGENGEDISIDDLRAALAQKIEELKNEKDEDEKEEINETIREIKNDIEEIEKYEAEKQKAYDGLSEKAKAIVNFLT